jgi:hypothetical protein
MGGLLKGLKMFVLPDNCIWVQAMKIQPGDVLYWWGQDIVVDSIEQTSAKIKIFYLDKSFNRGNVLEFFKTHAVPKRILDGMGKPT